MKKRIFTLIVLMFIAITMLGCGKKSQHKHTDSNNDNVCDECGEKINPNLHTEHIDNNGDGKCDECGYVMKKPSVETTFSYYENTKLPANKKIYVVNATSEGYAYSSDDLFTLQAIQGLFARDEAKIYVDGHYMTNGTNVDMYYLQQAKEKYGLEVEYISLPEAVQMYKDSYQAYVESGVWGSKIPLENYNNTFGVDAYTEKSTQGYKTPGYIVYKAGDVSVNIAATLAGITGFIPVEKSNVKMYQDLGLVEKFNVDSAALTYRWLFNIVMEELSTKGLIHQNYKETSGTNKYIKDYGISNKYFYVYYDEVSIVGNAFKKTLHSFLDKNCPIFGYTYSEDSDVAFFSQYGQFVVPTDYTNNLTFFACEEFIKNDFKQPNDDKSLKADKNKHYVAFVVSDGDNATYWQNTATFATNYMNAAGRENDTFPVTWSISPSLADLMPSVLDSVYNVVANEYDYFCAPVSGQGYINAGNFAAEGDGAYFADFCEKLDIYMGKSDLNVVTVIGGNSKGNLPQVLKGYADCVNVTGGIIYDGNKYFGANPGGIMWINNKPFVQPRDSLWETTPAYIAARINTYPVDITSIDGYSIINVHPWSHSYDDIRTIVSMLNDNVEVVSVDRIIEMMADNIKDKSNTSSYVIPEKNGVSISTEYLQRNPSLIPVDPLFNDFLLWEEDWKGTGVTYNANDPACSNVGAMYKGNISIAANTTATKDEFTLPNIEDYWFSFNARCDSTSSTERAKFNVYLTIDGNRKQVMGGIDIKGITGTGTLKTTGDGWQCFAIPLAQYFPEYQGKTCKVEIEVLNGGKGIRLDQVAFKQRMVDPAIDLSGVDVYNNEFNVNTEDWLLGEQYKTSQYYWWNTIDRESLEQTGSIQIDCSDGGGDEKRNGNTNMWMAKNYTLPEIGNVVINFEVSSENPTGAALKISLYVDGKVIVLYDWQFARTENSNTTMTLNLSELYPDVNFHGQQVTVIFEARDGGCNNGVGEACKLMKFVTYAG